MQLERRFDWNDLNTVYQRADENVDFEPAKGGMVSFAIRSVSGKLYRGRCFPTTAAQMVDTPTGFWKLTKGDKYNLVIPCNKDGSPHTHAQQK